MAFHKPIHIQRMMRNQNLTALQAVKKLDEISNSRYIDTVKSVYGYTDEQAKEWLTQNNTDKL